MITIWKVNLYRICSLFFAVFALHFLCRLCVDACFTSKGSNLSTKRFSKNSPQKYLIFVS